MSQVEPSLGDHVESGGVDPPEITNGKEHEVYILASLLFLCGFALVLYFSFMKCPLLCSLILMQNQ
jgi:hypothetical protein